MYHLSFIAVLVSGLFVLASSGQIVARDAARPEAAGELLERFRASDVFYEQHDIARALIAQHERSVLPKLVSYLRVEDRHVRANAALIFAGLGDPRGFDVLVSILSDRSDRPDAQGRVYVSEIRAEGAPTSPQRHLEQQIATDRYYAAALLGELKDPRAIPALIPLLEEPEVNFGAVGALEEIGGKQAMAALIKRLSDRDPSIRVLAIRALAHLHSNEAIPAIYRLLDDKDRSHVDDLVSVGEAAREALVQLGSDPGR